MLQTYEQLSSFLDENPQISNKLACGVRELLNLPYLKVIFCAFAGIGVQLIEPFYARTIDKKATHSTLKKFYKELYSSLNKFVVTPDFLAFNQPAFPGVSQGLFDGVKDSYGVPVLQAVIKVAQE